MPSIDELLAFLAGRPAPVQPGVPLCRCGREPAIEGDGAPVGRACVYRGAAIADRPWTFTEPELAAAWSGRTDVLRLENAIAWAHPTAFGLCVHRRLAWAWTPRWPTDDTTAALAGVAARAEALADTSARAAAVDHAFHAVSIDGCSACADEAFFRGRRAG